MKWICLILGGVTGTLARYGLSGAVYGLFGTRFPYGTLAVNVSGCLFVGFLAGLAEEKFLLGPNARVLLMAGFCGAFTTFSTLMLETAELFKSGETFSAFLNMAVSVALGFLFFRAGLWIAEIL
ncbi:MAG: fluoride efflux transporter CrcB [Candidatus Omnitrophota bacterium]